MSEKKTPGRSRRRFLADMLFLGGGITAAALLTKSQLDGTSPLPDPSPSPLNPPPQLPPKEPEPHPAGAVPIERPPMVQGEIEAPNCTPSPQTPPEIQLDDRPHSAGVRFEPQVEGRRIAPNGP